MAAKIDFSVATGSSDRKGAHTERMLARAEKRDGNEVDIDGTGAGGLVHDAQAELAVGCGVRLVFEDERVQVVERVANDDGVLGVGGEDRG